MRYRGGLHPGRRSHRDRPPGPKLIQLGVLWSGHVTDPYALLPALARRYGDVVDIPMPVPGSTWTLVSHPDHVDHIMTRHHHRYLRHSATAELVIGDPEARPLLEGDEWKLWRRPLNPFFAEQALAAVSPRMESAVIERVDEWAQYIATGEWIDLEHELGIVVMDGLMRSMFSAALDTGTLTSYVESARNYGTYMIVRGLSQAFPRFLTRPFQKRGDAARDTLLRLLDDLISHRHAEGPREHHDILDALIVMSSEACPHLRHRRLRTDLAGLVFAGFETTSEALAWTIALLCRNPAALAKAYAETDALGDAPVTYAHLERLRYLRACFDEAQRIQGAPANIRTAADDDVIDGYHIPAGSHVLVSPRGLHRDPRFWVEPEQFQPGRFLTDTVNRNAFIPFNVGPRKCMGWRLAYIEGLITLATILQRYRFEIRAGWAPQPKFRIATGLRGGLPVRVVAR